MWQVQTNAKNDSTLIFISIHPLNWGQIFLVWFWKALEVNIDSVQSCSSTRGVYLQLSVMQTCQSCATPQKQRIMGQGMHRIHYGLSQNVFFFVLFIVYSFDPGWFFVFNSSDKKKKTMPELCSFCHACVDCVVLCVSGPCFSVRVSFSSCLNHSDTAFHLHCREAAQCAVNSNKALSSCSLASWVLEVFILALTRGLWYGSTSLSCSMWTTECVNEYAVTIRWNLEWLLQIQHSVFLHFEKKRF